MSKQAESNNMRLNIRKSHAILLMSIVSPVLLNAQFQRASPEELKMTSDPKAPGAAAVYLDIEDSTDDMLHARTVYVRIKILQEKGKELATVELPRIDDEEIDRDFATMQLPYQQTNMQLGQPGVVGGNRVVISDLKARTIHADGTIVPLEGKLEDLLKKEMTPQHTESTVVHLPGVEVGSILEYRFVERYDGLYSSPHWQIQRNYFVQKAHYSFLPYKSYWTGMDGSVGSYLIDRHGNPLNYLVYYPKLPSHAEIKRDGTQHFILDVADVPAAPQEEWMPPSDNMLYRVLFYYRSDSDAKDFWTKETRAWSKRVDRLAEPTSTIKDAVGTLIVPGDSDLEKAKKLYRAVQALDNTDFHGSQAHTATTVAKERRSEETWTQKSGSSEDIALLYLSMLRAAGLTAYDMKVVNRDHSTFAPEILYFDQLDDDIIFLDLKSKEGKEIVLDPGQKMCPFGVVHWKHTGAGGIREGANGKALATSPFQPYTANTLTRIGDIKVDDHGVITGSLRFTMDGQDALRWRQEALLSKDAEVKKQFDQWMQSTAPAGLELHLDRFEGLASPDANLTAFVRATGSFSATTAHGLQIPCFPFEVRARQPFTDETGRLTAVDMHYGNRVTDQVTYHLPAEMKILGIPQEITVPWESHAIFTVKAKAEPGQITIARSLDRAFALASQADFKGLREFYEKVDATDKQELHLSQTTGSGASSGAN
jgi:hypothetical protein